MAFTVELPHYGPHGASVSATVHEQNRVSMLTMNEGTKLWSVN